MRRPNSTLIVVAGEAAERVVAGLGELPNVRAVTGERTRDELPRAIASAASTYVVHAADPLAGVRDAWVGFFDGTGAHGRLEAEIELAAGSLGSGAELLPDYYVVLDPEALPATPKHWWLGVLAGAAPARVVPAAASAGAVRDALARLPAGRWWPADPAAWLRELPRTVPDQAGLALR
ncbi:hypothetical protein [Allonocardiopsis opalescens]|uniref:Uncharacterized protein n=1 Tax=Allonocardiopsis opalescens TaxID=1144618 RepID=A0A2T0Q1Y2_9ACTN|nr:hypothetical protein [Allonocardiopsis opalescens]PRX97806.1 hypothetical protein CLV72_105156 [Allonocardiopsis opalescens]